jgi:predicted RNA binding protein YcfA (HicA-like mRNA interferase family)
MKIRELERKLRMAGCWFVVHGKRHDQWYSPITDLMFSIPRHATKEVPDGTFKEIQKQSGIKL